MEYRDFEGGLVGDQRDRAADRRDRAGDQRDQAEVRRDHAADRRDHDGDERDRTADRRDRAADRRDRQADLRDCIEAENEDDETGRGSASVRLDGESDRLRSRLDRQAAASERTQAEFDRVSALADRVAASSGRDLSGIDRGAAMADRAASANDRNFGSQFASSLQFGWTIRTLDPPEFLYASPGYLTILGLPARHHITLAQALAMVHPDDQGLIPEVYWVPPTGGSIEAEMRIIRPDGEIRWIRSTSNPVVNPDGTVTRAAAMVEDITDRKTAETSLRAAQLEAEHANAAKSHFLSRVSHELRTPLNAVLGFAQLLELDDLPEPQAAAVDQILQGGRHLLQLIDDVLDISRVQLEQLQLTIEPVRIASAISEVVRLMQPVAATASITMRYTPGSASAQHSFVLADRRRLKQVLLNLLSNAVKYNGAGGTVDVTTCTSGVDEFQIDVRDTGIGIAEENLPRLFTMFDRLEGQALDTAGTGIGLAHSESLVKIMHGRLEAVSVLGTGSTFSLVLPLTRAPGET